MALDRRTFGQVLATGFASAAWQAARATSLSAQTAGRGQFVMDFSGLCLYERWEKDARVRVLLAKGRTPSHRAILIANLKDVNTIPLPTEALLVTPDGQELGIWDLSGVDASFLKGSEPALRVPSVNVSGSCPTYPDTPSLWNSFHWLADVGTLCGSDKVLMNPPINGQFLFERGEVQCVMPLSRAARRSLYGFCASGTPSSQAFVNKVRFIQPMVGGAFTLELSVAGKPVSFSFKAPRGGARIAVSICNLPKTVSIGSGHRPLGTSHFSSFYDLMDGPKTQPELTFDRECRAPASVGSLPCGSRIPGDVDPRIPGDVDHCPGGQVVHL